MPVTMGLHMTALESVASGTLEDFQFESFPDFYESLLATHHRLPAKTDAPLMTPACFADPNGGRRDSNVHHMSRWLLLDVDCAQDEALLAAVDALLATGWRFAVYSSFNHGIHKPKDPPHAGTNRVRLVVELDRDTTPAEWLQCWDACNATVGGIADRQCRKPSQPYYIPSCPEGADPISEMFDGSAAPVAELIRRAPLPAAHGTGISNQPAAARAVTLLELDELATKWKRKRSTHMKAMGTALRHALDGEPIAPDGARDETLWRLCAQLIDEYPTADATALAAHLAPGLEAMSDATQRFTVQDAARKMEHQRADRAAAAAAEAQEKEKERLTRNERRIRASSGGTRTHEATEEEIQKLCAQQHVTHPRELTLFWTRSKWAYTLAPDGNIRPTPVHADDLVETLKRDLAVFPWFDPVTTTQQGNERDKTIAELRDEYGGLYDELIYDLAAERGSFDPRTRRLTIAPTPLRVQPQYSQLADNLLRHMDPTGKLREWVAAAPRQDKPTSMLVMIGERRTGKTLLARALARLRVDGPPAPLDTMGSAFNADARRSGLWYEADEQMGSIYKREGSAFLRSVLSTKDHIVNEKYQPKFVLRGYARAVVSANNDDILETRENLSRGDIEAFSERVLEVRVDVGARDWLAAQDKDAINGLVYDDVLAAHCLWLRDNLEIKEGARFLVEGNSGRVHSHMASSVGIRADVTTFLANYISDPRRSDSDGKLLVRTREGRVWVNGRGVVEAWELYMKTPQLSQSNIGRGLKGISTETRKTARGDGTATLYFVVDPKIVADACEKAGVPPEVLEATLAKNSEERVQRGGLRVV